MIQHKRVSPCPALLLSLPPFRASAGPKLETPVHPGSEKPILFQLRRGVPGLSRQWLQGSHGSPPTQTYQLTPSGVQAHPLRYTRDRGMLLSHTPKPSKAQEKANLGVGTHAQACKRASRCANGRILRLLCLNNARTQSPPDSQTGLCSCPQSNLN